MEKDLIGNGDEKSRNVNKPKMKKGSQVTADGFFLFFKCLIIRKICYVMTIVSKLSFWDVREVSHKALVEKGESKRRNCRQSVLNCFCSRVPELGLMYGRKQSPIPAKTE